MSEYPQTIEYPHPVEHPHPGPAMYLKIAVVLAVLTALEVAVYYVLENTPHLLAVVLIGLSAAKFALVAAFYMHLRFDNRLFMGLFVGGLIIAGSVLLAIITTHGVWWVPGYPEA